MYSPASLAEREAFLLALLSMPKEYHGSYILEKIRYAMNPGMSADMLQAALDEVNQTRYAAFLEIGETRP